MSNFKVGDKVVILRSSYEELEKFSAGAVLTVAELSVSGCGALLYPANHDPELPHNFKHGTLYFNFLEFRPMYKMSEMLQMAIDTNQYTIGDYMCHAIDRMALSDKITKQEAEFAKARISKQVDTVFRNRYKKGLCTKPEGHALAGAFTREKDCYKCAEQYFRKWIRDLRRRGN